MARHSKDDAAWKAQRLRVLDRDGWICQYCSRPLEGRDATVDHVEPISLDPERVYDDSELVAACRRCNGRKSDKALVRQDWFHPDWFSVPAPPPGSYLAEGWADHGPHSDWLPGGRTTPTP